MKRIFIWYCGNYPVYAFPKRIWMLHHWRRAKRMTKMLDWMWRKDGLKEKVEEATYNYLVYGESFVAKGYAKEYPK